MAIPLVALAIGAIGTAGFGLYKGGKAISDNDKANSVNERARRLIEYSKERLEKAKEKSAASLEDLGRKKLQVWEYPMASFVELFKRIKNIELAESEGLDELSKFEIDKQTVVQMREISLSAASFAQGALSGAVAGGAIAFGAYGAAGAFATASTGTAIAGLSGAAATNATLAFFGGGSLAAGGLGMAGGACVLGGIVAGPALAIVGSVMGAKARENLENAYSNLSKAEEVEAEVNLLVTACDGIAIRAEQVTRVLITVEALFYPLLSRCATIITNEGNDYMSYGADSKKTVGCLLATAQVIKAILDTPLLDEKGARTDSSLVVLREANAYVKRIGESGGSVVCATRYPKSMKDFPQEEVD